MNLQLTGLHHVSALSADIRRNHDFYTRVLGLRLVKKSVNQDSPGMYHLFYADAVASPGSDLTFFDLPMAARERKGNHSITRTTLRVHGEAALHYWARRLTEHGVTHGPVHVRDARLTLDFEDPEGLPVSFVDDAGAGEAHPWERSPVPAEHQVRGLGYSVVTVPTLAPTHAFLTGLLNLHPARAYANSEAPGTLVHVYAMNAAGPAAEIHVAVRPDLPRARYGAGGVHHVALRVPTEAEYHAWTQHLGESGLDFSGEVDRYYFRSLYVREPNGILFELATDGPGFATDEPLESLGERLALPPFLEPRRAQIEANLKPID